MPDTTNPQAPADGTALLLAFAESFIKAVKLGNISFRSDDFGYDALDQARTAIAVAKAQQAPAAAAKAVMLSAAQIAALTLLRKGPLAPGFFSGWGPHRYGAGAHRVDVKTPTATKLIALGFAETGLGEDGKKQLAITPAGLQALERAEATANASGTA